MREASYPPTFASPFFNCGSFVAEEFEVYSPAPVGFSRRVRLRWEIVGGSGWDSKGLIFEFVVLGRFDGWRLIFRCLLGAVFSLGSSDCFLAIDLLTIL